MAAVRRAPLLPPPLWFAAAWGLQRLVTRHRAATTAARVAAGAVVTASVMLGASAVAALTRAHTVIGPEHPERATALVTCGPFRFTRNPVYLALAGLLVAHAILRCSLAALAPAAGFVALMDRTQIRAEEHALRSRFTGSYDRYQRATSRWIPWRKPGRA